MTPKSRTGVRRRSGSNKKRPPVLTQPRRHHVSASSTLKLNRREALIGAAGFAAVAAFGMRPALADTVSDIKSKGTIVIGIQGDNPPWGFVNAQGQQDGIDKDVGDLFAKFLGVKAEYKPL